MEGCGEAEAVAHALAQVSGDGLNAGLFLSLFDHFESALELESCLEEFSQLLGEVEQLGCVEAGKGIVARSYGCFFVGRRGAITIGDAYGLKTLRAQQAIGIASRNCGYGPCGNGS